MGMNDMKTERCSRVLLPFALVLASACDQGDDVGSSGDQPDAADNQKSAEDE